MPLSWMNHYCCWSDLLSESNLSLLFSSRKNPIHFQECSHPRDDDYEEQQHDDDKDGDQPECPYGTDCYR